MGKTRKPAITPQDRAAETPSVPQQNHVEVVPLETIQIVPNDSKLWGRADNEEAPSRSLRDDLLHAYDRANPPVGQDHMVEIPPDESSHPMHPTDQRLFIGIMWGQIPAALFAGCIIAWAGGQIQSYLAVPGILLGALGMILTTLYSNGKLTGKKPSIPQYPGPYVIALAAFTWLLIGWQTWMWAEPQGYTQAQLDKAVSDAAATAALQKQLNEKQQNATATPANPPAISPHPPNWAEEEIATRADLWRNIQRRINPIVEAYNYSDTLLGAWETQISVNKKDYLRQLRI